MFVASGVTTSIPEILGTNSIIHPFTAFFSIRFPLFSILNLSPFHNSSLLHSFHHCFPFSSNHTTFIFLFFYLIYHLYFLLPLKQVSSTTPATAETPTTAVMLSAAGATLGVQLQ
jgi:hypothetical protein